MLTINIVNDGTGTDKSANYAYDVFVNFTLIASGRVNGHNRKDGWKKLLSMIALDGMSEDVEHG